ncbi:MAG TPA: hypothetical protein PKZ78_12690, partial [Candidatus Goldiibacteriota bacterium]|nr:hypothetical protein [Candidatus Goldiibacteriota bacterium]
NLHIRKFREMIGVWEEAGTTSPSVKTAETSLFAHNGYVYVAFSDPDKGYKLRVIKYNQYDVSGWVNVGSSSGFSISNAYSPSVFVYDGTPYIAFRDTGNSGRVSVMKYEAAAWSYVGSSTFSNTNCDSISLFVHSGTPFVAYKDGGRGNTVTVARNKTGVWEIVGYDISAGEAEFVDLSYDTAAQMPYVIFRDATASLKATVMRYTGSY